MKKIIKVGRAILLFLLGLVGLVGIYAATQIFILPDQSKVSSTLSRLYDEDQEIRRAGIENPVDIVAFIVGDWLRINKVRRMVAADLLSTAEDYANAARILQHGDRDTDYLTAQELSLSAYALGAEDMLRHSALAEDRYLLAIGEPQKYGSQFLCDSAEGWQLSPVDPSVTDEERLQVNIEPLADMEMKIEELNQMTGGQCTLTQETIKQIEAIMEDASQE